MKAMAPVFAIVILAAFYVLLPVALDAYRRFRRSRIVGCPENHSLAEIQLDAGHAARTALFGAPQARVQDCSRWPARAGCDQACLPTSRSGHAV